MSNIDEQNESQFHLRRQDSLVSQTSLNQLLDKNSERSSSHSLTAKHSVVDFLDIQQHQRKSSLGQLSQLDEDSYSQMLRHSVSRSQKRSPRSSSSQNHKMFDDIPNFVDDPNSSNRHECLCPKQGCSEDGCPCSLAINQFCIIDFCCTDCISKKNIFLSGENTINKSNDKQKKQRLNKVKRQHNHIKSIKKSNKAKVHKQKYDFVYCTCKKTQCMKKYCPCYALNKQCNQCCICQQCQNCSDDSKSEQEKKTKKEQQIPVESDSQELKVSQLNQQHIAIEQNYIQQEIDNYFQESPDDYTNVELNRIMNFQPVDFSQYRR